MERAGGIASAFLYFPHKGVVGRSAPNLQVQVAGIHHKRTGKPLVERNRLLPSQQLADGIEIGLSSVLGSLRSPGRVSGGS